MANSPNFDKNSVRHTLIFAIAISLICSIMVSASAVILANRQAANVLLDQRRNILVAAGVLAEGESQNAVGMGIHEIFEAEFEQRIIDLTTGRFVTDIDSPADYDQLKAARQPDASTRLTPAQDIALLLRRENKASLYIRRASDGSVNKVVLPVRGYGLWGTLYGYLALEGDYRTVAGLGFYAHKETPGLGGEVDNPRWKAQWPGKLIYDNKGAPAIRLLKGAAHGKHDIDALAGATLTSRGVENLVRFWTGELGFGPFLQRAADATQADEQ